MTQTERFIAQLEALDEGERSRLRRLAGQGLDETVPGFDLFTGLWWPLRQKNKSAPRREIAWLIAKIYGACAVPHFRPEVGEGPSLAQVLGGCEPREEHLQRRFRRRFDAMLLSPLLCLEPHLRWALSVVADAVEKGKCSGIDWALLLNHLSIWDRGEEHRLERDVRDIWAEKYLNAVHQYERR